MSIVLKVVAGPAKGRCFSIEAGQKVTIGRSPDMEISLPSDRHMSRRHLQIDYDGNTCAIADMASSNGTFINKKRISDSPVRSGDYISAGDSIFLLQQLAPKQMHTVASKHSPVDMVFTAETDHLAEAAVVLDKSNEQSVAPIIVNTTSFPATTMFWKEAHGTVRLTIIIKATFSLDENHQPQISDQQWPILTADEHYDDDPAKSVRFETDIIPFKPRADVVLVGSACSPDGKAVRTLDVGLRVGMMAKVIKVIGDRYWAVAPGDSDATATEPKPFTTMPLVYERAYGGIDQIVSARYEHNPVGMGYIAQNTGDGIDGKQLPNLEDPRDLIDSWQSRPRPAAFGFYGRRWIPRISYAGDQDEHDHGDDAPATAECCSAAFFNGAHPDLQFSGYLEGNEMVELVHLGVEPRIKFLLPDIKPQVLVKTRSAAQEEVDQSANNDLDDLTAPGGTSFGEPCKAELDTLVLVPDEHIFYQVFRSVYTIPNNDPSEIESILITQNC